MLQETKSQTIFNKLSELWVRKYANNDKVETFMDYFETNWLDTNANWYEGYANDVPSTNNALESTNISIY